MQLLEAEMIVEAIECLEMQEEVTEEGEKKKMMMLTTNRKRKEKNIPFEI